MGYGNPVVGAPFPLHDVIIVGRMVIPAALITEFFKKLLREIALLVVFSLSMGQVY